ncbi:MAG: amino acid adenylation domain-containing protein [Verrucomicrobiales bacterium]
MDNVEDIYTLSPAQEGMLFHSITEPDAGLYVDQLTCRLSGNLDMERLRRSWQSVFDCHPALRTLFLWDELDEPLQVVRRDVTISWDEKDWRDGGDFEQRLGNYLDSDRLRGFDLARAPLARFLVAREAVGSWRFVWSFHHLLLDGWSAPRVFEQAWKAYAGKTLPRENFRPFRDYIAWQKDRDPSAASAFWARALEGLTAPTRIPAASGEPERAGRRQRRERVLDGPTSRTLEEFAKGHRLTLNTVFHAAWGLLLQRYTGSDDLLFGSTVSGRPAELEGIENLVGCCINTLPFRVRIDGGRDPVGWMSELQSSHVTMREYEFASLRKILNESKLPRDEDAFDTILVFENYPFAFSKSDSYEGVQVDQVDLFEQSHFPLALLILPGSDGIRLIFLFDETRFSARLVERLEDHLLASLRGLTDRNTRRLDEIELMAEGERARLEALQRGVALTDKPDSVLPEIEHWLGATPDRPAIWFGGDELSYGELRQQCDVLARRLRSAGAARGARIAVAIERSPEMIAAILATLRSGAAYVPIDPAYPEERIRMLLEDSGASHVFAAAGTSLPAGDWQRIDVGGDEDLPTGVGDAVEPASADDLAYVIFTSGSTGRPKGVAVSHGNLAASNAARRQHYGAPVERFLLLSSISFDSSVAGIFWTLAGGGTLVLPAPGEERDIDKLSSTAGTARVTHTLCLPSLYEAILQYADPQDLQHLRTAVVAGERCPPDLVQRHQERLSACTLHNEYGPSEGTVWSSVWEARPLPVSDLATVPIGRPIPGADVRVMSPGGRQVPIGVKGEIWVGGPGLVAGYLGVTAVDGDPFTELPGEQGLRFYRTGDLGSWTEDGELLFLGRCDEQLKVRGHRIEPGEIAAALLPHPAVAGAGVVGRRDGQLVAAVVLSNPIDPDSLRDYLAERLPDHMVPSFIRVRQELPSLPNGKLDRRALSAWASEGSTGDRNSDDRVAPRNQVEQTLTEICASVLGIDPSTIGIHDTFNEIGGDSITSIHVVSRARSEGIHVEPKDFLQRPTIAGLAAAAGRIERDGEAKLTNAPGVGTFPLTPIQSWFLELDLAEPGHWNQAVICELAGTPEPELLGRALSAWAGQHEMLRAGFERGADGSWRQEIAPSHGWDIPWEHLELPPDHDRGAAEDFLREAIGRRQGEFKFDGSPLVRVIYLTSSDGGGGWLGIILHHLVTDAISWSALVEDLDSLLAQDLESALASLPPRSVSFAAWARQLESTAGSQPLLEELDYWDTTAPALLELGKTTADGSSVITEETAGRQEISLPAQLTSTLLGEANRAYRTTSEELLLTAFLLALDPGGTDRNQAIRFAIERHGRSPEVSRTVGWFTHVHPVEVGLQLSGDHGAFLKEVKESLRAVPGEGRGFGLLRYQCPDQGVRERLADLPGEQFLFNYLGGTALHEGVPTRVITSVNCCDEASRAPQNQRPYGLEINLRVTGDRLVLAAIYDENRFATNLVRGWLEAWCHQCEALAGHCLGDESGGLTPSDFPDAKLDSDELDALFSD